MILVIGYGNPLRSDDGLGPRAAALIAARGIDGVKVLALHQLGPELAEDLSKADFAVFIDATALGEPGALHEETVAPDSGVPGSFSHHLSPSVLLGCSLAFYGSRPEAIVLTVTGESFDHGEGLTPAVEGALPRVVEKVLTAIDNRRMPEKK